MDHEKLIAKIQHFYDFMNGRLQDHENKCVMNESDLDRLSCKEKALELQTCVSQYSKVFQDFLYNEPM